MSASKNSQLMFQLIASFLFGCEFTDGYPQINLSVLHLLHYTKCYLTAAVSSRHPLNFSNKAAFDGKYGLVAISVDYITIKHDTSNNDCNLCCY